MAGDWSKGGLRYKRLKRKVPELLAPERTEGFFIAVAAQGDWERAERNWAVPRARTLTKRETVVAVTDEHLCLIPLKGPATFSWALDDPVRYPLASSAIEWDGKVLRVQGAGYGPVAFHQEDAERVAAFALRRAHPDGPARAEG